MSETRPSGDNKASTALPKPPLHRKNRAKKRCVSTTHDSMYYGSGHRSGFSWGPGLCHQKTPPKNWGKKLMT